MNERSQAPSAVDFLGENWCELDWTPWLEFGVKRKRLRIIPRCSGVYRVRVTGKNQLAYIGQTGRNLRERVSSLMNHSLRDEMAWNDPHTAAPALWSYRDADGLEYSCSVAPVDAEKHLRMALESYLLWRYRIEAGDSPLCNFGRLHPQYVKSRNRSTGRRGYRLPDGKRNPNWAPGVQPLTLVEKPSENGWMGLNWSMPEPLTTESVQHISRQPGVYRLTDATGALAYLGETVNLNGRLQGHLRTMGERIKLNASFCPLPDLKTKCQRLEIETDMIGGYYAQTSSCPRLQFRA